ncbi:hypothetical protein D9M71_626840 [compost metagenome]
MSLIKGSYPLGTGDRKTVVRWLDERTGITYYDADGTRHAASGFTRKADGLWSGAGGYYRFTPDTEPADWFIQAHNLKSTSGRYFTDGPYTEQDARSKAAVKAAKFQNCTYSVYQVLPGNTVRIVPPTPPQPEVIWS